MMSITVKLTVAVATVMSLSASLATARPVLAQQPPETSFPLWNPPTPQFKRMAAEMTERYRPSSQRLNEANLAFGNGDMDRAERLCREAIALSPARKAGKPWDDNSVILLGQIRLEQGRHREARDLFLSIPPRVHSDTLCLGLAIAYARLGDYSSALKGVDSLATYYYHPNLVDRANADWPGLATVKQVEASLLLEYAERLAGFLPKRGESALRAANKLLRNNACVTLALGKNLDEAGHHQEALPYLKSAARTGHGELAKEAANRAETLMRVIQSTTTVEQTRRKP